jgi:hypothetical protein
MTEFGYTAMCEQTPVRQLVGDIVTAEEAGFDFVVMSDHYFPWLEEQGHSGYAWSVLGAAAQATSAENFFWEKASRRFIASSAAGSPTASTPAERR